VQFTAVQDDLQHKFASQVAENKRLQSHLTNAKNELTNMARRMAALEDRVRHLELDIGEDEK
jgi:Skp family chaperone for outer membrane proteins